MTTRNKRPYPGFAQDFSGNSQTDPSQQAGADVNVIVAQYANQNDGQSVHQVPRAEDFGDVPSHDYGEAMRRIAAVDSAFAELPSAERAEHKNDPELWLESLEAPESLSEALTDPDGSNSTPDDEPAPQDSTEDREGE